MDVAIQVQIKLVSINIQRTHLLDRNVKSTRKHWKGGNDHSIVCGAHFKAPDDFVGWDMYQMGYRRQLNLVPGAIPSIRPQKAIKASTPASSTTPSPGSSAISDTPVPPKKRRSAVVRKLTVARVSSAYY